MSLLARAVILASGLLLAPVAQAQSLFGWLLPPAPALEANGPSNAPTVSANGKVFAFSSSATNWVPGSITGAKIISIDLVAGDVVNLSTTIGGTAFNGNSFAPSTSRNGRYTAFETQANNLELGVGTNGFQVVRKDRQTGALVLASASAAGAPATGTASGQARDASISGDGRYVVFRSDAGNLVGVNLQGVEQAFFKDLQTGAIAVLEALSLGVPVIGYDHGGVGEILRRLYPAGLTPLGNLEQFTERVKALLTAAPPVPAAPAFPRQRMLDDTLALYAELSASPRNRP